MVQQEVVRGRCEIIRRPRRLVKSRPSEAIPPALKHKRQENRCLGRLRRGQLLDNQLRQMIRDESHGGDLGLADLMRHAAAQEFPVKALTDKDLWIIPYHTPGYSWVWPEAWSKGDQEDGSSTDEDNNQDAGNLTEAHLGQHTFWADHDEARAEEDTLFESLFPHIIAKLEPGNKGNNIKAPPPKRDKNGRFQQKPQKTVRWNSSTVRQVLPDSDELRHLGLPSDEDEFNGRTTTRAALLS